MLRACGTSSTAKHTYKCPLPSCSQHAGLNSVNDLQSNPALARQILNYHILPPVPVINATWTTPFFAALSGPIATASGSDTVAVVPGTKYASQSKSGRRGGWLLSGRLVWQNGP